MCVRVSVCVCDTVCVCVRVRVRVRVRDAVRDTVCVRVRVRVRVRLRLRLRVRVYGVRCAMCGARCAVCGMRCAVCGVRCAVCGVRRVRVLCVCVLLRACVRVDARLNLCASAFAVALDLVFSCFCCVFFPLLALTLYLFTCLRCDILSDQDWKARLRTALFYNPRYLVFCC